MNHKCLYNRPKLKPHALLNIFGLDFSYGPFGGEFGQAIEKKLVDVRPR